MCDVKCELDFVQSSVRDVLGWLINLQQFMKSIEADMYVFEDI